ncbi:hypothetical protein [Bradyrhizobium cytisi]|uniref:hypothetical protein n=1 Tax=Bradyrhizobium cytisi TaxID=515489 RepID=UPI00165304D8|nr:hypothetical protein [Bradyrhizobium cytisi]
MSPHPRAFAALALHHVVALPEQTFALTIFAFLLLLDVRAFFTDHEVLLPLEGDQTGALYRLDPTRVIIQADANFQFKKAGRSH